MKRFLSVPDNTEAKKLKSELFTEERRAFLKEHGWVVIENVVPLGECEAALNGLKTYLASYADGIDPPGSIHGINTTVNLQCQMDMRQHESVHRVFSEFWNTPDLRVSLDRWCYYRSASAPNYSLTKRWDSPLSAAEKQPGFWMHTDEGSIEPPNGFPGHLQGFVNLIDCTGDTDGGLVVLDRGHLVHKGYFKKNNIVCKENWYKYPAQFISEVEKDASKYMTPAPAIVPYPMQRIRVKAPAGALVLWYSKVPHQNWPPKRAEGRDRAVIYVSMAPGMYETRRDIENRKKALHQYRCTSHLSVMGVKLFPKKPYLRSKEDEARYNKYHQDPSTPYQLTDLGKRLLGI